MNKLHIIVAEKRTLVRDALCILLRSVPIVAAIYEATTHEEVENYLTSHTVDLLLIHQSLVADIALLPRNHFVIIADEVDTHMLLAASKHNACGYLLRENASEALLKVILRLVEKEGVKALLLDTGVLPALLDSATTNITMLTEREREVLYLLHEGRKNFEIAKLLSIEETTVRTHVVKLLKKLSVTRYQIPSLPLPNHN